MAKCLHDRVRSTCSVCSPETVYNQYRYKATKQRDLVFLLTLEQFERIVREACVFCGTLAEPRGIDRRDNLIGYVASNCQAACGPCNMLKKELDQHTFLGRVKKIQDHQDKLRKQNQTVPVVPEPQPPRPGVEQVPGQLKFHNPDISPEARRYLDGARS